MASSKKPQLGELPDRVERQLAFCVGPGQTLLLGLSGGLDSSVLLHLLVGLRASLGFELRALHVNHGISPNAAAWETFCADLCAAYQVPYTAVSVSVPRDAGLGLEAAARQVRYQALLAQPTDAVVLAHHLDDQAETLLLQLLRGAGVQGLAAMPERRELSASQPVLLRPLLDISRSQLQRYAHQHHLRWIEDESNLDLAFDRNFLRHRVFPHLAERFPACRTTLARSAAHLAEASALLQEVAVADAANCVQGSRLALAGLRALSPARASNLLRYWLDVLGVNISSRRLREVMRQLLQARQDAQPCIAVTNGNLQRYRDAVYFVANDRKEGIAETVWRGEEELAMSGGTLCFIRTQGQGLPLSQVQAGRLTIQRRQGGEKFRPDRRRPNRSLRHLLQEAGMAPWQRRALPLLYLNGRLALVPGIGVACDLQAAEAEEGLLAIWRSTS
jgi:tRNA(Ile)-lysidine synthase